MVDDDDEIDTIINEVCESFEGGGKGKKKGKGKKGKKGKKDKKDKDKKDKGKDKDKDGDDKKKDGKNTDEGGDDKGGDDKGGDDEGGDDEGGDEGAVPVEEKSIGMKIAYSIMIFLTPPIQPEQTKPSTVALVIYLIINIIIWCFIIVALYIIYYCIFVGYPQFLMNLFSFSMKHAVLGDDILKANNTLMDHYKIVLDAKKSLMSPYDVFQQIYGDASSLKQALTDLDSRIQSFYGTKYRYDEVYYKAFGEYFVFKDVVFLDGTPANDLSKTKVDSVSRIAPDPDAQKSPQTIPITVNGVEHSVKNSFFYKRLLAYKIAIGEITPDKSNTSGDSSHDTLLWNLYSKDKNMSEYTSRQSIAIILAAPMVGIKTLLISIKTQLNTNNLVPYIVLPSSTSDIQNITKDSQLFDPTKIYLSNSSANFVPFESINEYSWYIFEIQSYMKNKSQFSQFASEIGVAPSHYMTQFVNLPVADRANAILKMNLPISDSTRIFINKHPIFSHIFLGNRDGAFYNKVMDLYVCMMGKGKDMTSQVTNLSVIGSNFKQWVNAVNLLDLYFNRYEKSMVKLYIDQYMDTTGFFYMLWMPFFKDMIINRIAFAFRDWGVKSFVIKSKFHGRSEYYDDFSTPYLHFKDQMQQVVITTWKGMFTSSSISQPAPPEGVS